MRGFAYFAVAAGVFITAFYSFRMYFLVFHGEERFRHKPFPPEAHDDHAAHDEAEGHGGDAHATHAEPGAHGDAHHDPHESPWVVTLPLVLLAIPSVVIGAMTIGPMLFGDFFTGAISVFAGAASGDAGAGGSDFHGWFEMALRIARPARSSGWPWPASSSPGTSTCAGPTSRRRCSAVSRSSTSCSTTSTTSTGSTRTCWRGRARMLGTALWKGGDVGIIDGVLIDGSASTIGGIARSTRRLQSGYLYWYALVMIVGVIGLMTWQLWPFLGSFFGH